MSTQHLVPSSRCSKPLISKCISTYTEAVSEVYRQKLRPDKLQQALDDDEWRFNALPTQPSALDDKTCLTKEDLTRLVRWKITHGVYRPFLPAQAQKNDNDVVKDCTAATAKILLKLNATDEGADECILEALKEVTKLKGVGPATGSLVLSVLARDKVVFFQDELFGWLFPAHAKLKYDVKEYKMLLQRCRDLMTNCQVQAWELEKAAYVLMHLDVLSEQQKQDLLGLAGSEDEAEQNAEGVRGNGNGDDSLEKTRVSSNKATASSAKAKPATKSSKRKAATEKKNDTRRSKRRKE